MMWIKQAHIIGFGQWQDQVFDFNPDMQVIEGLNEAGKTTLHQFIRRMLFGFPQAKGRKTNTYEPINGGPYGGSLTFVVDDVPYVLSRLGRTNTTVSLRVATTGQEFSDPEAMLRQLLGPVDDELYTAIFSFDQEQLANVFNLKPDAFNDYLRTLATPGSEKWLSLSNQWAKQAGEQYGQTKTAHRPLNMALLALQDEREKLQLAVATQPSVKELAQQKQQVQARLENLTAKQQQAQATHDKQVNYQQLLPIYRRWRQLHDAQQEKVAELDAELVEHARGLSYQLSLLDQGIQALTISDEQLATTTHLLNRWATLKQQRQTVLQELQRLQSQQLSLLTKYNWVTVPSLLTEQQQQNLEQQSSPAQATNQRLQLGLLSVGVIIGLLFILMHHVILGIIAIVLGLGAYGYAKKMPNPAISKLDNDLQSYGDLTPVQILAAQNDIKTLHELSAQQQTLTTQEQALEPQIQAIAVHLAWLGDDLSEAAYRQKLADYQAQQITVQQQKQQRVSLQQALFDVYEQLGVTSDDALQEKLTQQQIALGQNQELQMLETQLGDADFSVLATMAEEETATEITTTVDQQLQTEVQLAQQELAKLALAEQQLLADTRVETQQQLVADQETQVIDQLTDFFVKQLAADWVKKAFDNAIADKLPNMMRLAGQYLDKLTMGRYQQILTTKTTLKVRRSDDTIFSIVQLSKGTGEQVYVALRLAFIKSVQDTLALPLLIDDAFIDFDEPRRTAMLHTLQQLALEQQQVFYFTARPTPHKTVLNLNQLKGH